MNSSGGRVPAHPAGDARAWMESPECGETSRAHIERLLSYIEEIKRLASDPFASEAVALRACLLAANEALGIPGPQPSPERDIARAIIREARGE